MNLEQLQSLYTLQHHLKRHSTLTYQQNLLLDRILKKINNCLKSRGNFHCENKKKSVYQE